MKKALLFALMCLCHVAVYSQILFEKAYFITNNGKKTDCLIENLAWRSNPTWFNYKLSETDDIKKETMANVSEFAVDQTYIYKRFNVNIERSQTTTNLLQVGKNPIWTNQTVYLQLLVSGDANLYSYTDGNMTKYFFETTTHPLEQLVYIKYFRDDSDDNDRILENNYFRQQLSNAVKCDNMDAKTFERIGYNKNALVKHFMAYNACHSSSNQNEVKNYDSEMNRKTEGFSLSAQVGFHAGKIAVRDPYNYFNMSTDLQQFVLKLGFQAEYVLPFNKNTWSLIVSPVYQKFEGSKNYVSRISNPGFFNDNEPVHYTLDANYSSVEIPVGLRHYFFLNQHSRVFVNIAYLIDLKNEGRIKIDNSDNQVNGRVEFEANNSNALALGAGYRYKKLSGELRYQLPRELSSYGSWSSKYSSFGLNLYYQIF